jgi:CysZ protein
VIGGPRYLLRGLGMWRQRPGLMATGMVPPVIVLAVLGTALVVLVVNLGDLAAWLTPFADDWEDPVGGVFRFAVALVVLTAALVAAVLSFTGLTLLVGEPFYERIWAETERMLGGEVPEDQIGLLRAARDGAVLVLVGAATGLVVLVLGVLPVVGTVVGIVLGFVVAGRFLARELLSRPLAARGLDRASQENLLRPHRSRVLGFGIATHACFLVPLGAIVVMPAAVVGATMLARDLLDGVD